ncbi:hypothetical protein [Stigmatella erecta]|uniref:Uncharacterized protein n=1 Tax=Stigmatella erecta TaxID=83460 RepID=A0A1I0LAX3_9BACT|nr:hypothetical protein [Stigmatella erecta]SEU36947.1 hypothetical protein SAMN05443639_12319 [Stigmatella erecta]
MFKAVALVVLTVGASAGVSAGAVLYLRRRRRGPEFMKPIVVVGGGAGPPMSTMPVPGKVVLQGF